MSTDRFPVLLSAFLLFVGSAACSKGTDIAKTCSSDSDCDTGLCFRGISNGYCTSVCETEGSTNGCPEETVCKPIQGADPRCLKTCLQESDCSEQTDCNAVANTELRACEPTF